jgi:EAL domain-containing protein (putative c-di-GMP-specific phosphodiesterase class I)
MPEIDRWVVEHAIKALAQFAQAGSKLRSPSIFRRWLSRTNPLRPTVRSLLKDYEVPGERICFEITEQMAVRFAVRTDRQLSMLRDLAAVSRLTISVQVIARSAISSACRSTI